MCICLWKIDNMAADLCFEMFFYIEMKNEDELSPVDIPHV